MSIFSQQSRRSSRGFTLIELLVVMTIMVIISGLLFVRQAKFDSSTLLRSLAYSVALSVRQAQVYGSSVLGTATAQGNCTGIYLPSTGSCYASAYGIFLTTASPTSYTLFADLNSNNQYDSGENIKVFNFSTGYSIKDFCAVTTGTPATTRCAADGTLGGATPTLHILFKRPNPDAIFINPGIPGETYTKAYVTIQNSADSSSLRSICIYTTGQIAVEPVNIACP